MPDLSDGINWSEIDANNNNASPNGWPEGMMPSGVNDAARADRGALKRFWDKINPMQTVTPAGGVYTFTTANPAYPTAYIAGEIYCFHPTAGSVGSDQFQVNGILPKPILKRVGPGAGSFAPIIAQDIVAAVPAQLVYDAAQNSAAGGFILLNPFVPISGDGAGGVSVPGGLTVAGDFITTGSIVANGGTSVYGDLQVTGQLSVTGYKSRSGVDGPYQTNLFNLQWAGADGAHLWIDSADQGRIVTTSPAGDIVVGGNLQVNGQATFLLNLQTNGWLHANGEIYSASDFLTPGAVNCGNVVATGSGTFGGGLNVAGTGGFGGGLTVNGSLGGAVAIRATGGALQSDIGGTALYLPNGNVVCQAITAAGNRIILQGSNAPSVAIINTVDGSIKGIWNASNQLQFGSAGGDGSPQATFAWFHPFGDFHINNSLFVSGNVTIGGTLNGLPGPWMAQLDALSARVRALEEKT